jgi:hypothetical protein
MKNHLTGKMASDPKVLLGEINQRLRGLLNATGKLFRNDDPVIENLENVLRQTTILQMMQGEYAVAIAGVPGAGKSTLIKSLYNLDTFISGRTGRGERLPIWVREMADVEVPRAYVHAYYGAGAHGGDILRLPVASTEAFEAIAHEPRARDEADMKNGRINVLLELHVPPRVFGMEGYGFLLLPGLEHFHLADRRDSKWNQLILFSLIAASRYLLVVNNVANYQELAAYEQFQEWFRNSRPLFVLPGSDKEQNGGLDKKEALREKLNLTDDEADRIVCTGLENIPAWTSELSAALHKYSRQDHGAETVQLVQLAKLFDKVLFDALNEISFAAEKHFHSEHSVMERFLQDYLEGYEGAVRKETNAFMKILSAALEKEADDFQTRSEAEHGKTGFWQHVWNFTFRQGQPSPDALKKVKKSVCEDWNKQLAHFTERLYQDLPQGETETLRQLAMGDLEQLHPTDGLNQTLRDTLKKLPKLTSYALMQRPQRVHFLREKMPQVQPNAAQGASLLGPAVSAVSSFLPSDQARVTAAVSALVIRGIDSVQRAEQYSKKKFVADLTGQLYDQTFSVFREDYTRLSGELQDVVRHSLAKHLKVEDTKNEYQNIRLRISQMRDSIAAVKELVNNRTAHRLMD